MYAALLLLEERADTLEAEIRRHADEARVVQERRRLTNRPGLRARIATADTDALAAKLLAQDTKAWQDVPYPRVVIDLDESPTISPRMNGHARRWGRHTAEPTSSRTPTNHKISEARSS